MFVPFVGMSTEKKLLLKKGTDKSMSFYQGNDCFGVIQNIPETTWTKLANSNELYVAEIIPETEFMLHSDIVKEGW